jgi:peroxiredoxin Q/BCP
MARTIAAVISGFLITATIGVTTGSDRATPTVETGNGPAVGQSLPAFETTDDQDRPWKSADHFGKKVLVMYFYPGDFTGGCTRQAQVYRDALAKIEELGAEVVGVSGDEVATHQLFKATYGLRHSLLSDPEGGLAKRLGVPVKAGGKVAPRPGPQALLNADGNGSIWSVP